MPVRNTRSSKPRKVTAKKVSAKPQDVDVLRTPPQVVVAPPSEPAPEPDPTPPPHKVSERDIVDSVLAGEWGKGQERRLRLRAAGHDHRKVQAEIVRRHNIKS